MGQEERRAVAPNPLDFHELLRLSLSRPWAKRGAVLAVSLLQAIPAAYSTVVLQTAAKGLGPAFAPGAAPPTNLTPAELDALVEQLTTALDPYTAPLIISGLAALLLASLAAAFCTLLFSSAPPAGGIAATAFRRFLPVVATNLLVSLVVMVAAMACCFPAIPASAAMTLAVPSVVLGGLGPLASVRLSFQKVMPHLWTVVGVELMLWSLVLGSGMVTGALETPLQAAFGDAGGMAAAGISAYLATVLGTTRFALGVVVYERLMAAQVLKATAL